MLKAKVHPKIVQERLGHSTIAVTLDIYSHVLEGMQEDAAEIVDGALQAALNKRRTIGWQSGSKREFRSLAIDAEILFLTMAWRGG